MFVAKTPKIHQNSGKMKNLLNKFSTLTRLYSFFGVIEKTKCILRKNVDRNPSDIKSRFALANIELTQGNFEQARCELEELLRHAPDDLYAFELLGEIAVQQKKYDEAIQYFKTALSMQPENREIAARLERAKLLLTTNITIDC